MGLRERKKEKRRSLIVQEFGRLFALHGLDGFTMKDIADSLDISLRTLYNYYENREELLADYMVDMIISLMKEVEKLDLLKGNDFCQDMHILLFWFLNTYFSDKNFKRTWMRVFLDIKSWEGIKKFEKATNYFITLVYKVIWLHRSKFKNSSFLAAEIFGNIFDGVFFKLLRDDYDLEAAKSELKKKIEIVYEGMRAK